MANLIVRNIDERVAQALKARAAKHNRSAEAEHRAIMEDALLKTRRRSLAQVLAAMPNTGSDEDFQRVDENAAQHVFD